MDAPGVDQAPEAQRVTFPDPRCRPRILQRLADDCVVQATGVNYSLSDPLVPISGPATLIVIGLWLCLEGVWRTLQSERRCPQPPPRGIPAPAIGGGGGQWLAHRIIHKRTNNPQHR